MLLTTACSGGEGFSFSNNAGDMKLNPRNSSWAVALGGIPGESSRNKHQSNLSSVKNNYKKTISYLLMVTERYKYNGPITDADRR